MIIIIIFLKHKYRHGNPASLAGLVEAPSYPPSHPMAKRAVGSRSIYEAPGKTWEGRTMAGTYQEWPAENHEAVGGSEQDGDGSVEMWVSPSHGG